MVQPFSGTRSRNSGYADGFGRLKLARLLFVLEQSGDVGMISAQGALGISFRPYFTKCRVSRIEVENPVGKRMTDPQDQLQGFRGLNRADDPGHHSDDAGLLATGNEPGRRRLLENTSIAGRLFGQNREHPALETENAAVDERLVREIAGIVDEKL